MTVKKSAARSVDRKITRAPMLETLEDRKLMAAVVDVRLPGGAHSIVDPTVGQNINFEVWVTVTGANSTITDEELQIAAGSVISSNTGDGTVRGTITTTLAAPFN